MSSFKATLSLFNVFLLWITPWFIAAIVLGISFVWFLAFGTLLFLVYIFSSTWLCLLRLGNHSRTLSPVQEKVSNRIDLIEIHSPARSVYLFKGYPGEKGVVAITSGELMRSSEKQLLKMIDRAEKSLSSPSVYVWTWMFPAYQYFSNSQKMLKDMISASRLILGLLWYAPFQVCKKIIDEHAQEYPDVDSVI